MRITVCNANERLIIFTKKYLIPLDASNPIRTFNSFDIKGFFNQKIYTKIF